MPIQIYLYRNADAIDGLILIDEFHCTLRTRHLDYYTYSKLKPDGSVSHVLRRNKEFVNKSTLLYKRAILFQTMLCCLPRPWKLSLLQLIYTHCIHGICDTHTKKNLKWRIQVLNAWFQTSKISSSSCITADNQSLGTPGYVFFYI